jgi:hypothetical protein
MLYALNHRVFDKPLISDVFRVGYVFHRNDVDGLQMGTVDIKKIANFGMRHLPQCSYGHVRVCVLCLYAFYSKLHHTITLKFKMLEESRCLMLPGP